MLSVPGYIPAVERNAQCAKPDISCQRSDHSPASAPSTGMAGGRAGRSTWDTRTPSAPCGAIIAIESCQKLFSFAKSSMGLGNPDSIRMLIPVQQTTSTGHSVTETISLPVHAICVVILGSTGANIPFRNVDITKASSTRCVISSELPRPEGRGLTAVLIKQKGPPLEWPFLFLGGAD